MPSESTVFFEQPRLTRWKRFSLSFGITISPKETTDDGRRSDRTTLVRRPSSVVFLRPFHGVPVDTGAVSLTGGVLLGVGVTLGVGVMVGLGITMPCKVHSRSTTWPNSPSTPWSTPSYTTRVPLPLPVTT